MNRKVGNDKIRHESVKGNKSIEKSKNEIVPVEFFELN